MCCWPLPAQSFSGLSPLRLEIIFYCLRFETSIFVASYDSQGHGGDIQPRLNMGIVCLLSLSLMSRPKVSWPLCLGVKHPSGAYDQIVVTCVTVTVFFLWGALSDEGSGLSFVCAAGILSAKSFLVPSPLGLEIKVKVKIIYDRRSAGQSPLEHSTQFGLTT
jgi:hypothetical protein